MANGEIQQEFRDTLALVGKWVKQYGASIYGTRGGPLAPQNWGVTTQDAKHVYVHILAAQKRGALFIPGVMKPTKITLMGTSTNLPYSIRPNGLLIDIHGIAAKGPDTVIEIQ